MRRKLVLPALAACMMLAVSAPVVSAKPTKAHAASIKSSLNKFAAAIGTLKSQVKTIEDINSGQTGAINGVDSRVTTVVANIATLKATVDAIVSVATTTIQPALLALKDGLTAAGAGLVSLKTLVTSTEYGFAQMIVISAGPTPNAQLGSFVETPDIPDSVQQAQVSQQFVAQHTGVLAAAYGIRSYESDGTGAADPAGACKVTVTNEGGATESTAANATLGGVPYQFVPLKSVPTSTVPANAGFPFGLKTAAPDADVTTTFASSVPVTMGDTYTVTLACVDTTPSTTDPSA